MRLLEPIIAELKAEGIASLNAVARALTRRRIPTARGASTWTPMQVARLLQHLV